MRPASATDTVTEAWSAYSWAPDGEYANYIKHSAISFMTLFAAVEGVELPPFLIEDLRAIRACFDNTYDDDQSRAQSSLRRSIMASKTNRYPDPFMIDVLLAAIGQTTEQK